jgi:hypothetical protein
MCHDQEPAYMKQCSVIYESLVAIIFAVDI